MAHADEQALIERARRDPAAFAVLYDRYADRIFRYAYKRTLDFDLAHDICSETFLKAYQHLGRFRWRNVPFSAWLYRIATNEINTWYRRKRYRPHSLDHLRAQHDFEVEDPQSLEQEKEEAQRKLGEYQAFLRIQALIRQLPLPYQEVLSLRYYEQKSIREISQILNKKEGTVKSLISRGLEKVRKLC